MDLSSSIVQWLAIGAAVAAAVSAALVYLSLKELRRVRAGQKVLMGGVREDLVEFIVALQARVDDLRQAVDEVAAALGRVDRRVDSALSRRSIVRYDALEGSGGQQSASIALLDSSRSGIVLSAIQGRDYARVYVKELDRGRASTALSPEEQEAVERAMAAAPLEQQR